jgi:hypothetical protein
MVDLNRFKVEERIIEGVIRAVTLYFSSLQHISSETMTVTPSFGFL